MGQVLVAMVGLAVLAAVAVDVLRTVLDVTHGGGPITGAASRHVWNLLVAWHRRGLGAEGLRTGGLLLTVGIVGTWVAGLATGWTLVYLSDVAALVDTRTGAPAGVADRLYFAAGGLFSLSLGDVVPGSSAWRLVAAANVSSGLLLLTLSITYAIPVIEAAARRRAFASNVWVLGGTPSRIVANHRVARSDGDSQLLDDLGALRRAISDLAHLHLAYPVLHFFHSAERHAAFGPNLAALYDALLILGSAFPDEVRPHRALIAHTQTTIETLLDPFLLNRRTCPEPPPPPDLAGSDPEVVATVRPSFELAVTAVAVHRSKLAGLVREEGWDWEDVTDDVRRPDPGRSRLRDGG